MNLKFLALLVLAVGVVFAQTTTQNPPSSNTGQSTTPQGGTATTAPQGTQQDMRAQRMQRMQQMQQQHQQEMQAMKADLDKMRGLLDQMKSNIANVRDANSKKEMQLNADLWQTLLDHMQQMMSRAEQRGAMGGPGMGRGGRRGNMGGNPPPPPSQLPPPPK